MNTPNIVYILADDMGYGDVRHLNPDCKFPTPHLDRLGQEGMYFSDAHSSSAVCTPSRYSILTGRYCWRTLLKQGVISGTGAPLIPPDRLTVAGLLKQAGYDTACIGKWHVGWDWAVKAGKTRDPDTRIKSGKDLDWIDYHQPIQNGPTTVGFDHFYGISGSLDMPPYVYIEDDLPVEEPTSWGTEKEFCREGPRMESLRANNVLGHLTDKAVRYVENHNTETPFFLYFPITAPHTPIAPAPEFDGISGINPYTDFCMEVDARVGQILDALDRSGQADNTLIIFTTDNGASAAPSECATLEERFGHYCSHIYRGYKSDIWDGGHRLPFLVRWPELIPPGSVCDQPMGLFDFMATAAELTGQSLPDNAGEDSVSFLPALQGQPLDTTGRHALIHHSIQGMFAIRKDEWKLCRCPGSGGWTSPKDPEALEQGLPDLQLYNLKDDPGETRNLAPDHAEKVEELTALLADCVEAGRTTPGAPQSNEPPRSDQGPWNQRNWLPDMPERFVTDD